MTIEVALDNLEWDEDEEDFRTIPAEDSGRTVEQIQGPGNSRPPAERMDLLREFLACTGWNGWEHWYRADAGEDWTGFVAHLLAMADREEEHDGIQP